MRWLLLKDLQILRRSPLLVGTLVVYPVAIALMIGFALSSPPGKPRVALLSEVAPGAGVFTLGGERINPADYAGELFRAIQPIKVRTRAQAVAKVRSGEALGALIIPGDIGSKLASGLERPTVEVVLNVSDPLEQRYVESTIRSELAKANAALSARYTTAAGGYIRLLLTGGRLSFLGHGFDILGLRRARAILVDAERRLSGPASLRAGLDRVVRFAGLAIDNLDLSGQVLRSVSAPVAVREIRLSAPTTPADAYAVAIAAAVSLMFITVLLTAGLLALEREENAFARLVRGLVSRSGLLTEKVVLGAACSGLVTIAMLAGIGAFFHLRWARLPLWLVAAGAGGLGFAALGAAIGSLAREVRAASLLAFLLSLPVALLALVPPNAVSGTTHDVLAAISAAFPFRPALQAFDAALNDASPGMLVPVAHLLGLAAAFGALARAGLRRFG